MRNKRHEIAKYLLKSRAQKSSPNESANPDESAYPDENQGDLQINSITLQIKSNGQDFLTSYEQFKHLLGVSSDGENLIISELEQSMNFPDISGKIKNIFLKASVMFKVSTIRDSDQFEYIQLYREIERKVTSKSPKSLLEVSFIFIFDMNFVTTVL